MDSTKLLIFVFTGFGLTTCSDTSFREYHYVNQSLTWSEAQNYCREKHTDLATIESVEDLRRLKRPSEDTYWSWIGLSDDSKSWKGVMGNDSNSWRWSATGKTSETGYQNWGPWEPNFASAEETCVHMGSNRGWLDSVCYMKIPFVCFNESNPPGQRNYTLITNRVTWTKAQTYCRTHHTDLATIENAQEHTKVMSVMSTSTAWIGLYRKPWIWSDKSISSFRNWRIAEPNAGRELCAAETREGVWGDLPCGSKNFFWCYKDLRVKKTMVRMKIQTFADLSDPAANAQILQQLSERFKTLHSDFKVRWVTQPTKQEEDADEDNGKCN